MRKKESQGHAPRRSLPYLTQGGLLIGFAISTWFFWGPLWHGGGLIGGDLYPYYFPQKQWLAESLQQGKIPLWNNRVGLGYPVLGESQTGALYPLNLLFFSLLKLNTAYNVSQIVHYIFALWGAWLLGRRLSLSPGASLLAAVTYVYGWFPARICLEWAILGGAFQVWMLWLVIGFRQTGQTRFLAGIAGMLGAHLLAGHYNLAFITLLLTGVLAAVPRSWLTAGLSAPQDVRHDRLPRRVIWLSLAILCGFAVAAVQLLPTWELKTRSQRAQSGLAFAPGYGHLPPLAITQLAAPWLWHGPDIDTDQALSAANWGTIPAATNKAEAYVYAGTIPLLLVLFGWLKLSTFTEFELRRQWLWSGLLIVSLLFATGWPIVWLQSVPGFAFFMGPGRYTIVSTLAIGVLSGAVLDGLCEGMSGGRRTMWVGLATALTLGDLWAASREYQFGTPPFLGRQVFYATLVDHPPIEHVEESVVRTLLAREPGIPRVYGPGPNAVTLTGFSAIPVYLGLSPQVYIERKLRFDFRDDMSAESIQQTVEELYHWGVTHLLLEEPVSTAHWPVEPIFAGHDPLLNQVFGRREPYYLYRLPSAPGRAWLEPQDAGEISQFVCEPERLTLNVHTSTDAALTISELMFPGWNVELNGAPAMPDAGNALRVVSLPPGNHTVTWIYQPGSVYAGMCVSLFGLIGMILLWRCSFSMKPAN